MQVYLDASFNASAAETRGFFGLFGTRSALTLGVPLLVALDRRQVLRHHRARIRALFATARTARQLALPRPSRLDAVCRASRRVGFDLRSGRGVVRPAFRSLLQHPQLRSFQAVRVRSDEMLPCIRRDAVAGALTRLVVLARLWVERLPRRIADWQLQAPEPPADFYERFARLCRECSETDLKTWLDKELASPSGWLDTHPSLSQRLASLKQARRTAGRRQGSAGEQLLGERAGNPRRVRCKWTKEARPDWLLEHLRRSIAHPLLSADAEAMKSWTDEQRLARVRFVPPTRLRGWRRCATCTRTQPGAPADRVRLCRGFAERR